MIKNHWGVEYPGPEDNPTPVYETRPCNNCGKPCKHNVSALTVQLHWCIECLRKARDYLWPH